MPGLRLVIGILLPANLVCVPFQPACCGENSAAVSSESDLPRLPFFNRPVPIGSSDRQVTRELITGDWETEVLGDSAAKQLKALGKQLQQAGPIVRSAVESIVSEDFACDPLRPPKLKEVYRDDSFRVLRDVESNVDPQRLPGRGVGRCIQALRALTAPMNADAAIETRFKVFKVSLEDQLTTTHVDFQCVGRLPSKPGMSAAIIQQNAVWICRWQTDEKEKATRLLSIEVSEFEEVTAAVNLFVDCTESILGGNESFRQQLMFGTDYWRSRIPAEFGIGVFGPSGIALGDVNGDERDDIYLCQPGGLANRLFVAQPDGTAIDMSAAAGIDWLDDTSSALFVDLDNDGDQDLILGTAQMIVVLANDGAGRFLRKWAQVIEEIPYSLASADYDNDGKLDFYVCVYAAGAGPFSAATSAPLPWHDAENGGPNRLFRNAGNWDFRDATTDCGLNVDNRRFSFAAAWEDVDNDGDVDLYVANDFGRNNLYENRGGRFRDIAAEAGVEDSSAGMSASWGDYNNDGRMDIYVSNMFSSAGNRITYQRRFRADLDDETRSTIQRHARGNSLFENTGDNTFRDVSIQSAVTMGRWAWGSTFIDFNNDGWGDLYVANGFVTQEDTIDL